MPNEPKYKTVYEEYVNNSVRNALVSRAGLYNYQELADMVGLKPTQHFKRRINQMVAHGKLVCVPTFTARGSIENRFDIPFSDEQGKVVS